MSARAQELATRLDQVNQDVIDAVISANGNLSAICPAEGWTAAALGSHIGYGYIGILQGLIKPIATGQEMPPFKLSDLDDGNAKHAAENAAMPQEQVLALLRENGALAAAYVRTLGDADLDRIGVIGEHPMTAQLAIERVLIGHAADHLNSLRQGLGHADHRHTLEQASA